MNAPLTGRAIQFMMYPLSLSELRLYLDPITIQEKLGEILRYGLYPGVFNSPLNVCEELLLNLSDQYLYNDLIHFENLKNSQKIVALLKLIALQVGSEVSIYELATQLGFSRSTVERFLDLLEKMFVIVRVGSFSRNLHKELSKKVKYYFYDLGVRNAILKSFNTLDLRQDLGALWENFCILERLKFLHNQGTYPNIYFWRTHSQQKIDYLEERNGVLRGFEFKWRETKKFHPPKLFLEAYSGSTVELVTSQNWPVLITKK